MLQGVDFSRGGFPEAAVLLANDKHFVGRYAVNDLGPAGRGITGPEYAHYKQNGIGVFIYWESTEGWMLGGRPAGQWAARNALANMAAAGMPLDRPIYFACDFDAAPSDQAAIDDCLRGAADVIGIDRVGIYGGYWIVMRCKKNGTARWFCQTSAWSGDGKGGIFVLEGAHLLQYDYNKWYGGVNCDLVQAYQEDYGQMIPPVAPAPIPVPSPTPQPEDQPVETKKYPTPALPGWWKEERRLKFPNNRHVGVSLWVAARGKSVVAKDTEQRLVASVKGRVAGPSLKKGDVIHRERILTAADGQEWVILSPGGKGKEGARVLRADLTDAPAMPDKEPKK